MRKENNNYYVKEKIIEVIQEKGGLPISIYDIESVNLCNGIIVPGGDDVIESDLVIIKYAYDIDKPLLGICLGMQEMGIVFNGKLSEEVKYEHLKPGVNYVHNVNIVNNSKLHDILGGSNIKVNSRHKNYLEYTDLVISGISDVIEAIEDKTKKFFIGVQWHPENMIHYDGYSNKIFDEFIKKSS